MDSPADLLERVTSDLRELLRDDTLAGLSDADRMAVLRAAGEASRLTDAVVVETVAGADLGFVHDAGCRMRDAGCRMPDAGCRMPDAGA
ncbi:hypothetical protein [Microbacterium tumbae]